MILNSFVTPLSSYTTVEKKTYSQVFGSLLTATYPQNAEK